jgi:hypothetical protein
LGGGDKIPAHGNILTKNLASRQKKEDIRGFNLACKMGLVNASDLKAALTSALQHLKEQRKYVYPVDSPNG